MNSLIRVCCVTNRVYSLQPGPSLEAALEGIAAARESAPDILVLPTLALSGACGGSLAGNAALLDAERAALDRLCIETADFPGYLIIGLMLSDWGKPAPVCAVLYGGELLGFVPAAGAGHDGHYSGNILPPGTVFAVGNCRFTVLACPPDELLLHTAELAATGCDLVLCPAHAPVYAGFISETRRAWRMLTKALGCAAALCNGGTGDSTSELLYQGFSGIYECGEELRFAAHKSGESSSICADLDTDIIGACKRGGVFVEPFAVRDAHPGKRGIFRRIVQNPFLACPNREAYLGELFSMQAAALAGRLRNTGIQRMVIGVSGGLDSTLALLVAARCADELGLSRAAILAVTMPGFGTTGRTYHNAVALMERLGCDLAEVNIKDACMVHFRDIGQDPENHDTTYENVQARERTQVLFDIAGRVGGLVLGTGDLSEEALGWCTFGGDHLAGYNVNVCLTKNMIRAVVKYVGDGGLLNAAPEERAAPLPDAAALGLQRPNSALPPSSMTGVPVSRLPGVADLLSDILATPVSPELLPAKDGEIVQKTEEILGTYDLHDFFTYYFVRYRFGPAKLFRYACVAFGAQLSPAEIKERLLLFLRRFFAAQFKRSCAPDAASITEVNLLPVRFTMPSDACAAALLEEAQALPVLEQGTPPGP